MYKKEAGIIFKNGEYSYGVREKASKTENCSNPRCEKKIRKGSYFIQMYKPFFGSMLEGDIFCSVKCQNEDFFLELESEENEKGLYSYDPYDFSSLLD